MEKKISATDKKGDGQNPFRNESKNVSNAKSNYAEGTLHASRRKQVMFKQPLKYYNDIQEEGDSR